MMNLNLMNFDTQTTQTEHETKVKDLDIPRQVLESFFQAEGLELFGVVDFKDQNKRFKAFSN